MIEFTAVEGPDAFESKSLCVGDKELRRNADRKSAFLFSVCDHMTVERPLNRGD